MNAVTDTDVRSRILRPSARGACALAAASLLVWAACESGPSPRERLESAARATSAETSSAVAFDLTAKMAGDSAASGMSLSGEGAFDREAGLGHASLELPAMGIAMRMVFRNDTAYVELPAAVIGERNQWVRAASEDTIDLTAALDSSDVALLLDAVDGDITSAGTEEVDGSRLEGFRFMVSLSKLREQAEAAADAEGGDTGADDGEGSELADSRIPMEVWLDADDRIRRVVATVDMDPVVEGARGAMSDTLGAGQRQAAGAMLASMADSLRLTLEFSDFGTQVEAEVPDDAEIMSSEELQERMQQTQAGSQPGVPPTGTGG